MVMSNSDESKSSENQQLPTLKDPKGCLDITPNHQKDDYTKKRIFLHQDLKECQDITMGHQKDDDTKETVVFHQDPKGCQDVTIGHQKDDDTNKIVVLHQGPNIAQDHRREDGVVNEEVIVQPAENEVVPEDDDDGFRTPTSLESKIPILTTCPPAPRPKRICIKPKAPPRRGQRTIRVWLDYLHRDSGRFWPEIQETNNTTTSRRVNTNK
ncbi:hypothetical protein K7X08_015833 [Anisodus acutangulus]|uniref:Uncharacterized protein n=1 Tax=Anisodus acutangulus TaxID=402998 RepID=A0A9Q1QZG6_9SOLA|nr:hypothetical protein K7X08_015833 [Anisodus acutangulus]